MKVFLLLLLASAVTADTVFTYNNDLSCGSISLDVGGKVSGSERLTLAGSLSTSSVLPEKMNVDVELCFMGLKFFCREEKAGGIDICGLLNLQGTSGEACPEAGSYTFEYDAKLPGDSVTKYLISGSWVTISATLTDSEDGSAIDSCSGGSVSISKSSSGGAMMFMASTMTLVGISYLFYKKRRRTIPMVDLERFDADARTDFVEMSEAGVAV